MEQEGWVKIEEKTHLLSFIRWKTRPTKKIGRKLGLRKRRNGKRVTFKVISAKKERERRMGWGGDVIDARRSSSGTRRKSRSLQLCVAVLSLVNRCRTRLRFSVVRHRSYNPSHSNKGGNVVKRQRQIDWLFPSCHLPLSFHRYTWAELYVIQLCRSSNPYSDDRRRQSTSIIDDLIDGFHSCFLSLFLSFSLSSLPLDRLSVCQQGHQCSYNSWNHVILHYSERLVFFIWGCLVTDWKSLLVTTTAAGNAYPLTWNS